MYIDDSQLNEKNGTTVHTQRIIYKINKSTNAYSVDSLLNKRQKQQQQ